MQSQKTRLEKMELRNYVYNYGIFMSGITDNELNSYRHIHRSHKNSTFTI